MTKIKIQQASPSAEQSVQFTLHIEEAPDALASFEEAIQRANWPSVLIDQFIGEIAHFTPSFRNRLHR